MLRKERTKAYLLSLAAAVLLMSNVYVGRAEEEPFEIVWKKDIGLGIGEYPISIYEDPENLYVASDKTGNFVIYRDSSNSLTVLDLKTGEFGNRIVLGKEIEIAKFRLLKNNTRLAVWDTKDCIYIYNTKNWVLERKFCGSFQTISEDMSFLISDAYTFYDYNTLDSLSHFYPSGEWNESNRIITILSKENNKLLYINLYVPLNTYDKRTLIKVFDLNTYQPIFVKYYEDWFTVFADDNINNVFVQMGDYIEINSLENNSKTDTMGLTGEVKPPFRMSKNQRYFYCGINEDYDIAFGAISTNKNGPRKTLFDKCTFADVGEDYVIGWVPSKHSKLKTNELIKLNIKDQNLVPVQDISNETEILYPNPANSIVHIPNIQVKNISEIIVIDEKGCDFSEICTVGLLPDGIDLNLQKLNTGVYFIRVGNSEFSKTYKVIKC